MARSPVGYRSPFNKISSVKASPMKAMDPVTAKALMAAAPGIISGISSLFGRKKRRREQAAARKELEAAKKAFESIEYKNPYAGLTNPYTGMENVYEDATVDTQAADYLREQQQQSQANVMANLRGVAGGSGISGLAQQMANISTGQARQASMQLAQQERANQQRSMAESTRIDQLQRTGASQVEIAKAKGEAGRLQQEQARTGALYGLSIERMNAADKARQTARSAGLAGLGQAAAGVAGLYAPGGSLYGTNPFGGGSAAPTGQGFNFDTSQYTDALPNVSTPPFGGGLGVSNPIGGNTLPSFRYDPVTGTYRQFN
tara:strand:- start:213 stop:1163 length:951 start_codon:yes stop_codon:yes gene_type:complete